SVNQSEKLKDIDLKDLGLAFAGERKLKKENSRPLAEMEEAFYSKEEKSFADSRFPYTAQKMSKTMNNNFIMTPPNWNKSKFLPCLNIVEKVEDDNGIFMDEEIDYEKKYYEEDFVPSPKEPKKIIITCTFKRFFSKTVKENILKLAAESPKKLSELVENARREITQKSIFFLYNQTDYQITELICQPNNYSKQAKVYKKEKDFQKIPEVLK
ncbi:6587_t:CDS:1, partial [Ambispora leptoticha]